MRENRAAPVRVTLTRPPLGRSAISDGGGAAHNRTFQADQGEGPGNPARQLRLRRHHIPAGTHVEHREGRVVHLAA